VHLVLIGQQRESIRETACTMGIAAVHVSPFSFYGLGLLVTRRVTSMSLRLARRGCRGLGTEAQDEEKKCDEAGGE